MSLISQTTFEKLWPARQLSTCHYRLRSYVNNPITLLGYFESEVHYKSQVAKLPLIVVEAFGCSGRSSELVGGCWPSSKGEMSVHGSIRDLPGVYHWSRRYTPNAEEGGGHQGSSQSNQRNRAEGIPGFVDILREVLP